MSSGGSCSLRPGGGGQVAFGEERCVDPVEVRPPTQKPKAYLKDANGKACESIGFIPGSAEPSAAPTCDPCASPRSCRTFVCSVLTCGLYRVCQRAILAPCLAPDDGSPEEPEKVSLRAAKPGDDGEDVHTLDDIRICGVKVVGPGEGVDAGAEPSPYVPPAQPDFQSLHESMRFGDWEEGGEDVDSLITRKLLELYSEYQIEELARCTTDSVFLKKTKAINQLINSLAEEHKMDEQEAECRLVRGIIRISTRKSKKKKPHVSRTAPSDSGNETWNGSSSLSFSNNSKSLRFSIVKPPSHDVTSSSREPHPRTGGHGR